MGQITKVVQILIMILVDFGVQQHWNGWMDGMEHTFLDLEIGDIVVMIAILNQVKTTDS